MTMRIYTSADASAPTLQGIVGGALSGSDWADGSLLQLFRKVLVTGYGSQTAAGWTQQFAGTSKGVFKQGAGCLMGMRVLDDGSLTAGAREAEFYGGEVFTDVDTAAAIFPTAAQQSTGLKMRKSDTADTTQRPWIMFADASTFYFFSSPLAANNYFAGMAFGNFHSLVSGDAYNCMAWGRVTSATSDTVTNDVMGNCSTAGNITTAQTGFYVARGYSQSGAAVNGTAYSLIGSVGGNNTNFAQGAWTGLAFPNPEDSTLLLGKLFIFDAVTTPTTNLRGWFRGFWSVGHIGTSLPLNYPFSGTGVLSGKTFKVLGLKTGSNSNGRFIMETSDTWDS